MSLKKTILRLLLITLIPASVWAAGKKPDVIIKMTPSITFVPAKLTIHVGDTVQWVSEDPDHQHQISTYRADAPNPSQIQLPAGAKPFRSGLLNPGGKYSLTF